MVKVGQGAALSRAGALLSLLFCLAAPLPPIPEGGLHPSSHLIPKDAWRTRDPGDYVLAFGRHRGRTLREVPLQYVQWLQVAVTDKPGVRHAAERFCAELTGNTQAGTSQQPGEERAPTDKAIVQDQADGTSHASADQSPRVAKARAGTLAAEPWLERWGIPRSIRQAFYNMGVHELFEWQIDCLEAVAGTGKSLIAVAGTSAGKSLVADVLLLRALGAEKGDESLGEESDVHDGGDMRTSKVIYVVPYVALVKQRSAVLRALTAAFNAEEGGGVAGGHQSARSIRISECYSHKGTRLSLPGNEIAVCTIEKANSLLNRLLEGTGEAGKGAGTTAALPSLVVIDEAHMVGDRDRGALLELLVAKLRALSPHTQLLALSATLHPESLLPLAAWLDAAHFCTGFRAVPLQVRRRCAQGTPLAS